MGYNKAQIFSPRKIAAIAHIISHEYRAAIISSAITPKDAGNSCIIFIGYGFRMSNALKRIKPAITRQLYNPGTSTSHSLNALYTYRIRR